jgi:hypothetical protein
MLFCHIKQLQIAIIAVAIMSVCEAKQHTLLTTVLGFPSGGSWHDQRLCLMRCVILKYSSPQKGASCEAKQHTLFTTVLGFPSGGSWHDQRLCLMRCNSFKYSSPQQGAFCEAKQHTLFTTARRILRSKTAPSAAENLAK